MDKRPHPVRSHICTARPDGNKGGVTISEIAEAFVRIRPNASGFKQEAEGHVAKAGTDLGRTFAKAFAIAGIAESIKGVVEATTSHEAAFALLDQTVKDAGVSNDLYGKSLEELLEKEARLKGFSDEELAASFQRLVAVTHDSKQAFSDLQKAEDLARFRHIDLAAAALAVSKAEQGSVTALQRYGIVVPHATEATDKLKAAHDAAVASGATFTAQQKLEYAQALKNAAATDSQGKKTEALALIQQRAGGSAAKYATTASGQFARLQQDFHQFENTVGEQLLPTLTSGAEKLGAVVTKIGPPLRTVVDDLGGLTRVAETLATVLVARKLYEFATAEVVVGTSAEGAAIKVTRLEGALARVKGLGPIAVVLAVSAVPASSKGQEELDKRDIGFLGRLPIVGPGFQQLQRLAASLTQGDQKDRGAPPGVEFTTLAESAKIRKALLARIAADKNQNPYGDILKHGVEQAAQVALAEATHNKTLISAGNAAIKSLRDGITTDQADLAGLKRDMADAVRQGAQAVTDAVQSAKQNLNTIGQSLAGSIATYIDKPLNDEAQRLSDSQDRIAARFDKLTASLQSKQQALSREQAKIGAATDAKSLRQLSQSVLLPGGHKLDADPQKALAQLEALQKVTRSPALDDFVLRYRTAAIQVQQDKIGLKASAIDARRQAAETGLQLQGDTLKLRQDRAAHAKQDALTQIANLTDLLNKGAISEPAFDKALAGVLKRNHLTFVAAAKADGIAYADTFAAQLKGLGLQEAAAKAGPQRSGSGLLPSIVKPLDTLNSTQRTIANVSHQIARKQHDELVKQTKLLEKLAGVKKAKDFTDSLSKNPGAANKRAADLANVPG